jgi:hypothetical protein
VTYGLADYVAALLAAGRPHTVLPLSGVGHLVAREGVADNLLQLELDFLKKSLGVVGTVVTVRPSAGGCD